MKKTVLSEHEINMRDLAAMFALSAMLGKTKNVDPDICKHAYDVAEAFMRVRTDILKEDDGNDTGSKS